MAKKPLIYTDQINFLALGGTHDKLVSVSYYLGGKGKIGVGAKNIVDMGYQAFLASLSPTEQRRFKEILASVQLASRMRDHS